MIFTPCQNSDQRNSAHFDVIRRLRTHLFNKFGLASSIFDNPVECFHPSRPRRLQSIHSFSSKNVDLLLYNDASSRRVCHQRYTPTIFPAPSDGSPISFTLQIESTVSKTLAVESYIDAPVREPRRGGETRCRVYMSSSIRKGGKRIIIEK